MSELLREIDEEVRRDQLLKLWRAYGKYAIGVALVVVLSVAGGVGWKNYQQSQRARDGARYDETLQLLESGQADLAAQRFALLADDAGTGYAALAMLREAQSLVEVGDVTGAVAVLDRLAADGSADEALRDLAGLLAVLHLMDQAPAEDIEARLEPLQREGAPWRASARELTAIVALRDSKPEQAAAIYTALAADDATPSGIRARAREMLAALGGEQGGS